MVLPPALTSAAATPRCFSNATDAIDRVAFGDPAEIELDARLVERDRPVRGIHHHVRGADVAAGDGELVVGRHAPFAAEESPRLHQRADGDVERARGLAVVAHRLRDEVVQLRVHRDRMPRRLAIEARQRAVGLVVAHQPIDAIDLVERFFGDARQGCRIGTVGLDGVDARHRQPRRLVAMQRPRRR